MDRKELQQYIKDFEKTTLTSLEIETADLKLRMTKEGPNRDPYYSSLKSGNPQPLTETPDQKGSDARPGRVVVKSHLVGTFYASSTPNGTPFVQVGQIVEKSDVLCIIEAMKIFNEILAPVSGVVERIDAKNGQVVGVDQVLIVIHAGEGRAQ